MQDLKEEEKKDDVSPTKNDEFEFETPWNLSEYK